VPAVAAAATPPGPAIVRLDLPRLTTTPIGSERVVLHVPAGTRGQWFGGERAGEAPRIGSLAATHLPALWRVLRLDPHGTTGTLTWRTTSPRIRYAVVRVSRPRSNGSGTLVFTAMADRALPRSLARATLVLDRGGSSARRRMTRSGFPETQTYPLSATLSVTTAIMSQGGQTGNVAVPTVQCVMTQVWQTTLFASVPYAKAPMLECGSTVIENGARLSFTAPSPVQNGTVLFSGTLNTGTATFTTTVIVASWTLTG